MNHLIKAVIISIVALTLVAFGSTSAKTMQLSEQSSLSLLTLNEQFLAMMQEQSEPVEVIQTHIVESGDNLWNVARQYNIDVDSILGANTISNPNLLTLGQELLILPTKGVLHFTQEGETLFDIAKEHQVSALSIANANNINTKTPFTESQKIIIPDAKPEFSLNYYLSRQFEWPASGWITSRFGWRSRGFHTGIDIGVPTGSAVSAARSGTVSFSGWNGGYGYLVIISHGDGYSTYYAHNSRLLVNRGQKVLKGQTIARSGNTGNSTGPHVHFEIRKNGTPVNPAGQLN